MNWHFYHYEMFVFPDTIPCPEICLAVLGFIQWILACVLMPIFLFLAPCSNMSWAGLPQPLCSLPPNPTPSQALYRWVNFDFEAHDRNWGNTSFCFFSINVFFTLKNKTKNQLQLWLSNSPGETINFWIPLLSLFCACFLLVCFIFTIADLGSAWNAFPSVTFLVSILTWYCRPAEVIALQ